LKLPRPNHLDARERARLAVSGLLCFLLVWVGFWYGDEWAWAFELYGTLLGVSAWAEILFGEPRQSNGVQNDLRKS
jgi:hypothetical protein